MIAEQYLQQAAQMVRQFFPREKAFFFGSSLREERFYDVDIAIEGVQEKEKLLDLKEAFLDSDFPRPVDVVDFDAADEDFRDYVLSQETKQWIS